MKGIPNRQKKVVTPKKDFSKDPKKYKQDREQVQRKNRKRHR